MSYIKKFYKRYQRFIVLFGGVLLNVSIGSFYTYNNMAPLIIEYMKNFSRSGHSVSEFPANFIFITGIFGMGSSVTFGDYIASRIGPSLTVLIAGWVLSGNVLLMSCTLKSYLSVVILTYGLLNGICTGIVYGVTMGTVCSWFSKMKGTVIGMLVAGFGLSACIFNFVQNAFLYRDGQNNWTYHILYSYILLGCIFIILQFIGAILIKSPAQGDIDQLDKTITEPISLSNVLSNLDLDLKPHNLIYEFNFWILWITYSLLSACIILHIFFNHKFGIRLQHINASELSNLSSASSFSHSIGGLIWGLIIDKYPYKIVMFTLTISLVILSGTFYFVAKLTPFYFIWTILFTFITSGIFSIFPQVCAKLFGQKNFIANYGMLYTAWSAGALIAGIITLVLYEEENVKLHFLSIFISGTIMAAMAALLTIAYNGVIRYQQILTSMD